MESHDHRSNAAVARVDACIKHSRVRLTKPVDSILVENPDDFIQVDLGSGTGQRVTPVCATLRLHQPGFDQNPHELARIRNRKPFAVGDLIQRQRLAGGLSPR